MEQRILIIGGNLLNQRMMEKILHRLYVIILANDCSSALPIISDKSQTITAIILDITTQNLDQSRLFLNQLAQDKQHRSIPVLVLTDNQTQDFETEPLQLESWDILRKPYLPELMLLRLRNIIGRSQAHLLEHIRTISEHDALTGLYNRTFFMAQTRKLLDTYPKQSFVLIRFDIDNFRLYNSFFGTESGNELLKHIASILRSKAQPQMTYGRIESDVFCLCVPYHLTEILDSLKNAETSIQYFNKNYRLKYTFGLYNITNPLEDLETMYSHATDAAKSCKSNINHYYSFYSESMADEAKSIQWITNAMETALEQKQFQVYLQPKYDLRKAQPCGAEALVRWIHPDRGLLSPGDFIPVFEKNGFILQLDRYMWESVCQIIHQWQNDRILLMPISVNISRISLYDPQIVDYLNTLVQNYAIPKELLHLEITESAYMSNPDLMKKTISELRDSGFVLMMDDFGSGYSSLNTLKDISMDILKIDMKFLPAGGEDHVKSEKILASIVRMAGWLGMPVIVEGVETREQTDFLESIGCHFVQGFYFARPMPVDDYESLIKNNAQTSIANLGLPSDILQNLDDIWASDAQSITLLKSVSTPFAIIEATDNQMDILRVNQSYTDTFDSIRGFKDNLNDQEQEKLLASINEAIYTHNYAECECLFMMQDGSWNWFRIRLNFIGTYAKTSLLGATFTNVTSERMLEKELEKIVGTIRENSDAKATLLVVDDSEVSRSILSEMFSNQFIIMEASNGKEALQLLKGNADKIAAILLDLVMPEMNGQEFLAYKNMMPEASAVPVLVISAEDAEHIQINMLEHGVNDYITKPFVPATVKQRLNNVLEYSSRFRKLVQEYHQANLISPRQITTSGVFQYSVQQIAEITAFMENIFDVVRLVDPIQTAIVHISPSGSLTREAYSCFRIWGKMDRCKNCTSHCAQETQCTMTKYELQKDDMFYVVSQPTLIRLDDGTVLKLVLEIASQISQSAAVQLLHDDSIHQILSCNQKKAYADTITHAFNRRFFDKMFFLKQGPVNLPKCVGLIILDLDHFKDVNTLYGHQNGDKILDSVSKALSAEIRENDSVIRYSNDTFVVVLINCTEAQTYSMIDRLRKAIKKIHYGTHDTIGLDAHFGYSFTAQFDPTPEILQALFDKANLMMISDD